MTKKKSKKANIKKKSNNNNNNNNSNNNNQVYNYICIGVIIIIILIFICKEISNKKEGFETSQVTEKKDIETEIINFQNITSKIFYLKNEIFKNYTGFDTEKKYYDYLNNYSMIEEESNNLKSKNQYILKLIDNYNAKYDEKIDKDIIKKNLEQVENIVKTSIDIIDKTITENLINQRKFMNMRVDNDVDGYLSFNLTIPAKIHLKENSSIFYVHLRYEDFNIYGPIIFLSDTEYKLVDINSPLKYYSSTIPIKIKLKDISDQLFNNINVDINIINNIIEGNSELIHLYGVDQNDTSNVFNKDYKATSRGRYINNLTNHEILSNVLKTIRDNEIEKYKDVITKGRDFFDNKYNSLEEKFNTLSIYGINKYDNSSSFYKELINDNKYRSILSYFDTLKDEEIKNDNILILKEKYNEINKYKKICEDIFKIYNKKLDKIIYKYSNRYKATTNNQFNSNDDDAILILGNNTKYFSDGIIDVGVFQFNKD